MNEIRIGPKMQRLLVLAVLGLITAAVLGTLPEIKRYLKIERM
jgi:hypothetical protein